MNEKNDQPKPTVRLEGRQGPGDRIGPYELVQKLGEGGMGQVYLARQREPVRRDVALKLIRWGMDTEQVVVRFELERQTLAIMEHPHIAKMLDAGATDDGRPYFVMEYVSGLPVTEYCDRHQLSTADRLTLFLDICNAVQHAHQRGIIHRDIKPSNVLVEEIDDQPVAKVIDFGVAKATSPQLLAHSVFTEFGQLVGTPEYMSPEQAELSDAQIDTRTDIYSLGVLLYELLVGSLPFDSASLRSAGLGEIYRILREQQPPRPSTRLSELGAGGEETARKRRTTVKALLSELAGELDVVILKAMQKDRALRYASASEFAADVQRFLKNEPVLAAPPGLRYRARKFARRNRRLVAAVAAGVAILLAGTAISTWQAVRATRAETAARRQADLASRTKEYLLTVFEQADPTVNPLGRETSIQEALDGAVAELSGRFADEPVLDASIRLTLGEAYDAMGAYSTAEELARSALEQLENADQQWESAGLEARLILAEALDHLGRSTESETVIREAMAWPGYPELSTVWQGVFVHRLAEVRQDLGHFVEADSLFLLTMDLFSREPGHEARVSSARQGYAGLLRVMGRTGEAETIVQELLAELPPGDESIFRRAMLRGDLASILVQSGKHAEAIAAAEQALADRIRILGPDHYSIAQSHLRLAHIHHEAHHLEIALLEVDTAIEIFETSVGPDHHSTFNARNTRANIVASKGKMQEALAEQERLLDDKIRVFGENHPDIVLARVNLSELYGRLEYQEKAEMMNEASLEIGLPLLGPTHRIILIARNQTGDLLEKKGDYEGARAIYESILDDAEADPDVGRHHPEALATLGDLGKLVGNMGDSEVAIRLLDEVIAVLNGRFPEGHGDLQKLWNNKGTILQESGDLDGASAAYARSLEVGEKVFGPRHPDLVVIRNNWAALERDLGHYDVAEQLFAIVTEDFIAAYGSRHVNVFAAMHNHGYTLIFLDRLDEAESELVAALDGLMTILAEDHFYCWVFRSSIGFCHARQGRYAEAEAELTAAWDAVAAKMGEEHPRSRKIAGYTVEMYAAWGREDAVTEWRARAGG